MTPFGITVEFIVSCTGITQSAFIKPSEDVYTFAAQALCTEQKRHHSDSKNAPNNPCPSSKFHSVAKNRNDADFHNGIGFGNSAVSSSVTNPNASGAEVTTNSILLAYYQPYLPSLPNGERSNSSLASVFEWDTESTKKGRWVPIRDTAHFWTIIDRQLWCTQVFDSEPESIHSSNDVASSTTKVPSTMPSNHLPSTTAPPDPLPSDSTDATDTTDAATSDAPENATTTTNTVTPRPLACRVLVACFGCSQDPQCCTVSSNAQSPPVPALSVLQESGFFTPPPPRHASSSTKSNKNRETSGGAGNGGKDLGNHTDAACPSNDGFPSFPPHTPRHQDSGKFALSDIATCLQPYLPSSDACMGSSLGTSTDSQLLSASDDEAYVASVACTPPSPGTPLAGAVHSQAPLQASLSTSLYTSQSSKYPLEKALRRLDTYISEVIRPSLASTAVATTTTSAISIPTNETSGKGAGAGIVVATNTGTAFSSIDAYLSTLQQTLFRIRRSLHTCAIWMDSIEDLTQTCRHLVTDIQGLETASQGLFEAYGDLLERVHVEKRARTLQNRLGETGALALSLPLYFHQLKQVRLHPIHRKAVWQFVRIQRSLQPSGEFLGQDSALPSKPEEEESLTLYDTVPTPLLHLWSKQCLETTRKASQQLIQVLQLARSHGSSSTIGPRSRMARNDVLQQVPSVPQYSEQLRILLGRNKERYKERLGQWSMRYEGVLEGFGFLGSVCTAMNTLDTMCQLENLLVQIQGMEVDIETELKCQKRDLGTLLNMHQVLSDLKHAWFQRVHEQLHSIKIPSSGQVSLNESLYETEYSLLQVEMYATELAKIRDLPLHYATLVELETGRKLWQRVSREGCIELLEVLKHTWTKEQERRLNFFNKYSSHLPYTLLAHLPLLDTEPEGTVSKGVGETVHEGGKLHKSHVTSPMPERSIPILQEKALDMPEPVSSEQKLLGLAAYLMHYIQSTDVSTHDEKDGICIAPFVETETPDSSKGEAKKGVVAAASLYAQERKESWECLDYHNETSPSVILEGVSKAIKAHLSARSPSGSIESIFTTSPSPFEMLLLSISDTLGSAANFVDMNLAAPNLQFYKTEIPKEYYAPLFGSILLTHKSTLKSALQTIDERSDGQTDESKRLLASIFSVARASMKLLGQTSRLLKHYHYVHSDQKQVMARINSIIPGHWSLFTLNGINATPSSLDIPSYRTTWLQNGRQKEATLAAQDLESLFLTQAATLDDQSTPVQAFDKRLARFVPVTKANFTYYFRLHGSSKTEEIWPFMLLVRVQKLEKKGEITSVRFLKQE